VPELRSDEFFHLGQSLIGFSRGAENDRSFRAVNPATQQQLDRTDVRTLWLSMLVSQLSKRSILWKCKAVLRYFGGLSMEEIAQALEVSAETVRRDLRMAEAWLNSQI
jgi:DNA-binding CsgD family transcriptional regulator